MVVNYPKTEAVVFGLPAAPAAAAATIQVGSNSVAVRPQFKHVLFIIPACSASAGSSLSSSGLRGPAPTAAAATPTLLLLPVPGGS